MRPNKVFPLPTVVTLLRSVAFVLKCTCPCLSTPIPLSAAVDRQAEFLSSAGDVVVSLGAYIPADGVGSQRGGWAVARGEDVRRGEGRE